MNLEDKEENELHPLFESGRWNGFFLYDKEKHEMTLELDFKNGKVNGSGHDYVGAFSLNGTYDLEAMRCGFLKKYSTHGIDYKGHVDENGIWGKWSYAYDSSMGMSEERFNFLNSLLKDKYSEGFHIWPDKSATFTAEKEEKKKSQTLPLTMNID